MNTNIHTITSLNGTSVEMTDRELALYIDLVRFSTAIGFNHKGAQHHWNKIVTENGAMMVDYLNDISVPARECNTRWGTEGHAERLAASDAAVHAAMQDIMHWSKPLF